MIVVSNLSRLMYYASEIHLKAAKRMVRYIKGLINLGISFEKNKEFKLFGFSDSDWARSIDDMKSTSRDCFSFGSRVFSLSSKKPEM